MLSGKIKGIHRDVLEMIIEVSRSSYPKEFVAMLRQEDGVISELHFLPGSQAGEDSAILPLYMRPLDLNVIGTVHCHPGLSNRPSEQDLELFRRFGYVHIIMCLPYDMGSWRSYDMNGKSIELKVVDD